MEKRYAYDALAVMSDAELLDAIRNRRWSVLFDAIDSVEEAWWADNTMRDKAKLRNLL